MKQQGFSLVRLVDEAKQEIIELRALLQQAHDALEANDIYPELTRQIATRLKQKDF